MKSLFIAALFACLPAFAGEHHNHEDSGFDETKLKINKVNNDKLPPSLLSCPKGDYPFKTQDAVKKAGSILGFEVDNTSEGLVREILSVYGIKKQKFGADELWVSSLIHHGKLIAAKMYLDEMKDSSFKTSALSFLNSSFSPESHDKESTEINSKIKSIAKIKNDLGVIFNFPEVRYFALAQVFEETYAAYASGLLVCSRGFSPRVLNNISSSIENAKK